MCQPADTRDGAWTTRETVGPDGDARQRCNGMALDHLIGHRRHPNRAAVGFRLLAGSLAA
jgi:hypothetical protein